MTKDGNTVSQGSCSRAEYCHMSLGEDMTKMLFQLDKSLPTVILTAMPLNMWHGLLNVLLVMICHMISLW